MIRSMTGYGDGTASVDGVTVTAEVRSVNAKGLDLSVVLPDALGALEKAVADRVRQHVARGKVRVKLACAGPSGSAAGLDMEAARQRADELRELKAALGLEGPVTLAEVLKTPGLFAGAAGPGIEAARPAVEAAVDEATAALLAGRETEGASLAADLAERRAAIAARLDAIDAQRDGVVERGRERIRARLEELAAAAPTNDGRLERELVLFADKCDIGEEVARLRSHLEQMDAATAAPGQGRKLEFIAQEMLREAGTIAVKANDAGVCHLAVEMKTEIARVREQAANVE
jgi:uncharacterized protein (TIGR00255 family)